MTVTNYSKWSDHSDRWVTWTVDTENISAPSEETLLTGPQFQNVYGLSQEDEYLARFGVAPGTRDQFEEINADFQSNPALLWPGETSDVAGGKFYGRPVPASAINPAPLPA